MAEPDGSELDGPRYGPHASAAPRQLVVLCHGVGADGHDLIELAPAWSRALPDAAFVAPSAPAFYDLDPGGVGRQWFSVADRAPAKLEAGIRQAAVLLDSFIDAELGRLGLPATAYALMGFSQGAMTVLFTGLRRPAAPRAILAFSGALIAPAALRRELSHHVPVLIVHGEADEVVPASRSREAEQALRAVDVPVTASYVPGLGHGIDETGLTLGARFLEAVFPDR
ncbi:MAG: alpha/beta hydrolase [Pseudomonadota bacterium]|nr:alpha/beta hydrolase [Pseudomonadota bacterium]